ncbi:MAG: 16S rRNA (guanine(527)-N(7))-methyltransferase RsmG, partial [Anaerolineae bacterium]
MQSFANRARKFGLTLSEDQLAAFETYYRELVDWNRRVNLTRITRREEVITRHFLDSLSIVSLLGKLNAASFRLIDVGSGAGFPGLPLKIACPALRLTLLEATGKKAAFLHHLVETLALAGVNVVNARAEEAGQQPAHRERYDLAVARAVAPLNTLAELTLPLVKRGGYVVAQKGEDPAAEVEGGIAAVKTLGGRLREIKAVEVPGLDARRHLVLLEKIAATPLKYPRRSGMPA